jgi:hypothetical protein
MQDLIKYLTDYFKKNGKMPTAKEVAQKINRSEEVASQLLEKLKKQGALGFYDGNYYIPNLKEQPIKKSEPVVKEKSAPTHTPNKKNIITQIFSAINNFLFNEKLTEKISENMIKIVMLVISIGCMIVSSNNTYEYFTNYLDGIYCVLAAGAIVVFGVFAFQAATLLRKKGNKLFASLLFISGVIALSLCMIATIHTQYKHNKIKENIIIQNKEKGNLDLLSKMEKELETNIGQVNSQIDSNQSRLNILMSKGTLSKEEQREYNNLNYNNSLLRNRIESYRNKLLPIREGLQKLYESDNSIVLNSNNTPNDFYSILGNIFVGLDPNKIEMLLYLMLGVFMDIMAPLGLAVFLGHYKTKEKIFNKTISEHKSESPAQ